MHKWRLGRKTDIILVLLLSKLNTDKNWRNDFLDRVFAVQPWGPKFESQEPIQKPGIAAGTCNSSTHMIRWKTNLSASSEAPGLA